MSENKKVYREKNNYKKELINLIRILFPYLSRKSRVKLVNAHMAQFEKLDLPFAVWPTGWQQQIAIELTDKAKDIIVMRTYIEKLEGSDVMKKELADYVESLKAIDTLE